MIRAVHDAILWVINEAAWYMPDFTYPFWRHLYGVVKLGPIEYYKFRKRFDALMEREWERHRAIVSARNENSHE